MTLKRVAFVTGAAGGLGSAVASDLNRRGYELALTDLSFATASPPAGAYCFPGDLSDMAFIESAVEKVIDRLGRVDLLVNVAAWRELLTLRTITPQSWDKTLRVCLTAPAFLARAAAADMASRGSGVIINVSSIMSAAASGIAPAYVAAKGGLDALTADMAVLFGRSGVRVVCVAPGAFDGPTSHDYGPGEAALKQFTEEMIPLGRWGTPQEIASAIGWIAGDEASYLTGTTIVLDGGWSRSLYARNLTAKVMPSEFK